MKNQYASVDTEEFIRRSKERHGDKYDYSKTIYKSNSTKVIIGCPDHGWFEQTPCLHYATHGCKECSFKIVGETKTLNRSKTFVEEMAKVHGKKYDLSYVEFKGARNLITVGCYEHGPFEILPYNFRKGYGCIRCAKFGYRPNKSGTLYVLYDGECTTKIGITNNKPQDRAIRVSSTSGKDFSVAHSYTFEDGSVPDQIETALLRELRGMYEQPSEKYQGSTECFYNVDQDALLSRINQLIQERIDAHNKQ